MTPSLTSIWLLLPGEWELLSSPLEATTCTPWCMTPTSPTTAPCPSTRTSRPASPTLSTTRYLQYFIIEDKSTVQETSEACLFTIFKDFIPSDFPRLHDPALPHQVLSWHLGAASCHVEWSQGDILSIYWPIRGLYTDTIDQSGWALQYGWCLQ